MDGLEHQLHHQLTLIHLIALILLLTHSGHACDCICLQMLFIDFLLIILIKYLTLFWFAMLVPEYKPEFQFRKVGKM